jgi:hypothetical protein
MDKVRKPSISEYLNGLREIGWNGMDWMNLARDRDQRRALVNTVMHFRVPYNAVKFLSSYIIGGFSRRARLHK